MARKRHPEQAELLPGFLMLEKEENAAQAILARRKAIRQHLQHLRWWLPDWIASGLTDWVSVHNTFAYSITHERECYHYAAPCRVLHREPGHPCAWRVEICYPQSVADHPTTEFCLGMNGEVLLLDLLDIWAPVNMINEWRRANPVHTCDEPPLPDALPDDPPWDPEAATKA